MFRPKPSAARIITGLLIALSSMLAVAKGPVPPVNAARGVAIEGYDPVAYFDEGRPVKGTQQFIHEWRGARWQFASELSRDRFAASPE